MIKLLSNNSLIHMCRFYFSTTVHSALLCKHRTHHLLNDILLFYSASTAQYNKGIGKESQSCITARVDKEIRSGHLCYKTILNLINFFSKGDGCLKSLFMKSSLTSNNNIYQRIMSDLQAKSFQNCLQSCSKILLTTINIKTTSY